ncbi:MAG: LuxR C-terminal-related transcriptional regulator [Thermodesulfobacteriota bacterium]
MDFLSTPRKKPALIDCATFKIFYDEMPIAVQLFDAAGVLCQANPAWESLWQARATDAIGRYNVLQDPQARRAGFAELFQRCLQGEVLEIPDYFYDPVRSGNPGRSRWLHSTMYMVHDALSAEPYVVLIHIDVTERMRAEQKLASHARRVEEANITMKMLLKQVTLAKEELERTISDNIATLILPTLNELENSLADRPERAYVQAIKANISQLTVALPPQLSARYLTLTRREQQVAELIRHGRSTKDIAILLRVSRRTVEYYRDTIRSKFGIKHRKVNLRSLLSVPSQNT